SLGSAPSTRGTPRSGRRPRPIPCRYRGSTWVPRSWWYRRSRCSVPACSPGPGCRSSAACDGSACDGEDPAQQVLTERTVHKGLVGVTAGRVERTAGVHVVAPRDRMVGTHRAAVVRRFVHSGQYPHVRLGIRAEVVPLVDPYPRRAQVRRRRMFPVHDPYRRLLHLRVLVEPGTDEPLVERPPVLRGRRGVAADEATT